MTVSVRTLSIAFWYRKTKHEVQNVTHMKCSFCATYSWEFVGLYANLNILRRAALLWVTYIWSISPQWKLNSKWCLAFYVCPYCSNPFPTLLWLVVLTLSNGFLSFVIYCYRKSHYYFWVYCYLAMISSSVFNFVHIAILFHPSHL